MASGSNNDIPSFDEILKRGAISEPKIIRPIPNIKKETELSLNSAVKAAKETKRKQGIPMPSISSEPSQRKGNRKQKSQDGSGFSSDGSPSQTRRRTPMTMPRTKITAATPLEQKIALKRLRQHLNFEEHGKKPCTQTNGEHTEAHNMVNGDVSADEHSSIASSNIASENQTSEISEVDTSKINDRLEQVREYIKQATGMYLSLSMAGTEDPKKSDQMGKLAKLIQQLRIQEQGYIDLLKKSMQDDMSTTDRQSTVTTEDEPMRQTEENVTDVTQQQQELERLKEQQILLKKIVEQQKELQQLKERQSTLLKMQENAENIISEHRNLHHMKEQTHARTQEESKKDQEKETSPMEHRLELENKLKNLHEKKRQMDELMETLKNLKNSQQVEESMRSLLNDEELSEVASEVLASAATDDDGGSTASDIDQKINRLNDVRERLQELRNIVSEYQPTKQINTTTVSNPTTTATTTTDASKDNRLLAQNMKQQHKQGNTLTGAGGARLRIQPTVNNQDVILKDLQALQNSIEELMDNRNRPMPQGIQKKNIDVTRNNPFKNKNTNQEKKRVNQASVPDEYAQKLRELNRARKQFTNSRTKNDNDSSQSLNTDQETYGSDSSAKDSDGESITSSALQWQDDPEFQTKVQKLQMAKEKLHHLQELVKVVQQGGGPQLPIDDLEDLTLTISDEQADSEYGESEEEAYEEGNEETDEEGNGNEGDEQDEEEQETECEEQSIVSKSTDGNYNFSIENGLSDNERRYQGLLRKQRLELNYLLKERERLLEAQRKLSDIAGQPSEETDNKFPKPKGKRNNKAKKNSPVLKKPDFRKQEKKPKESQPMRQLFPNDDDDQFYGSEHEYYPPVSSVAQQRSDFKVPMAALSNPMAVSEIRRQRDLFEQRKKQKFVEKQRRKKQNQQNDENQSEDRATYVIGSDIDEGVGVSMYSADVTTAATWGGSTEQSSDEEDSAVGDEYPAEERNDEDEDEYGSQFDQPEEEEEIGGTSNVPPLFKVKKFENPPRSSSIKWNPQLSEKKGRGVGSVSWSLDVSPPRMRKRPRQGNLTPAHKLIEDNKYKRHSKPSPEESVTEDANKRNDEVHSQLATICSSLLRNEQTLLQMLQNQMVRSTEESQQGVSAAPQNINPIVVSEIQDFFTSANHNDAYAQTLSALRTAYERIEQHQLDMEYLRQQFERLNHPSQQHRSSNINGLNLRSPWQNQPPSLHFSSFGPVSEANAAVFDTPNSASQANYFQKETQTETTLFEDPFRPSIQQYSLFGEPANPKEEGQPREFDFSQMMEPTSPGVVGDRSFTNQRKQEASEEISEEVTFPYRLRVSEYNPLSYQGNFPNTLTGNVMTVSKMSMNKKRAETCSLSETGEKSIWPSFFKLTDCDNIDEKGDNETSEKSSKFTSSVAGQSASHELPTSPGNEVKVSQTGNSVEDGNFSLFEALRDSIYSEVATLIAMNESRPHFLIELFRELQLLNSDYLRQRALYSLQEIITRYLTDENVSTSKSAFAKETVPTTTSIAYEQWIASASEQTPSESAITTTDDENESQALQTLVKQIQNNEMYDYAELADTQSEGNISTPSSQQDTPFAAEDLGNTVINLEDALQKMRTYEANMAEAKKAFEQISQNVRRSTPNTQTPQQQAAFETIRRRLNHSNIDSISNSSAGDVNSEASSDVPQPSVDTQKLDRQIKAVMMDLIPFLNDNLEQTCTEEFLDKIRTLIVEFAKQKEPGSEEEQFGRFFHSQLDSILRDSLMKFNSRKLKECGEDILIDVSEILFNELAFFKLMQDLDKPLCGEDGGEFSQKTLNDHSKMPFAKPIAMYEDSSAAESMPDNEEGVTIPKTSASGSSVSTASSSNAFVMIDPMQEISDDETESSRQFVKVELSVSEARPVRISGSDEDDRDEDTPNFSTQTAPNSSIHTYSQAVQQSQAAGNRASNENSGGGSSGRIIDEQDGEQNPVVEDDRDEGDRDAQEDERSEHEREDQRNEDEGVEANAQHERAEDQRDEVAEPESHMALADGDRRPGNDQAESNQQNEMEEGQEDDLPEADMVSEDTVAQAVLAHMEGQQELAGDPNALPMLNDNVGD